MNKKRVRSIGWVILAQLVALALALALTLTNPARTPLFVVLRTAAVVGFLCVYLSILSSAFMRDLVRLLGRPYLQVHHVLSISGLVLLTMHPIGVASYFGTAWLLPVFDSVVDAFRRAGLYVWVLLAIGVVAALLRKKVKAWRTVHWLNYLAFVLAGTHAMLIGSDTKHLVVQIVIVAMALSVVVAFVLKRRRVHKPILAPAR